MTDDAAEVTAGGEEEGAAAVQDDSTIERGPKLPEWAENAWRLYCRGQRNYSALGKQFGVDRRTVKANIIRFGELVRAAGTGSGVDAWQEAVTAQEEILGSAWAIHADAAATNQEKVSALKVAQDAIEQLAALNGVVTKRLGVQHSGDAANPVQFVIGVVPATDVDAVLAEIGATDDGPPDAAD